MDEAFVPKNGNGGYHVEVVWRDTWMIEGSKDDFFDLASMGWSYFYDMAGRVGLERAKVFLLENGFKLKPVESIPG